MVSMIRLLSILFFLNAGFIHFYSLFSLNSAVSNNLVLFSLVPVLLFMFPSILFHRFNKTSPRQILSNLLNNPAWVWILLTVLIANTVGHFLYQHYTPEIIDNAYYLTYRTEIIKEITETEYHKAHMDLVSIFSSFSMTMLLWVRMLLFSFSSK